MMKVDKKLTGKARKAHTDGVVRLNKMFGVTKARVAAAKAPLPKKRGGMSRNRRRVLARRQAHIRRAILCSATVYAKRNA